MSIPSDAAFISFRAEVGHLAPFHEVIAPDFLAKLTDEGARGWLRPVQASAVGQWLAGDLSIQRAVKSVIKALRKQGSELTPALEVLINAHVLIDVACAKADLIERGVRPITKEMWVDAQHTVARLLDLIDAGIELSAPRLTKRLRDLLLLYRESIEGKQRLGVPMRNDASLETRAFLAMILSRFEATYGMPVVTFDCANNLLAPFELEVNRVTFNTVNDGLQARHRQERHVLRVQRFPPAAKT